MQVASSGQTAFGRNCTFTLPANAELICGAALQITLPALTAVTNTIGWINAIGFYIFCKIEFRAQAQILDTQYPEFMDAWSRLTISASKQEGFNDLIGQYNLRDSYIRQKTGTTPGAFVRDASSPDNTPQGQLASKPQFNILVPMNFWWCNNFTQAIPIGVMLYSSLKLVVYFQNAQNLYVNLGSALVTQPQLVDVQLWVDYVFLDDAARNRIARDPHFFVFKQTQNNGSIAVSSTTTQVKMQFVLPVCHLMTFVRDQNAINANFGRFDWFDKFMGNDNWEPMSPISTIEIRINSQRRMEQREFLYHARYQPLKAHTAIPVSRGIFLFSFALFPEDVDASGDCNFSRAEHNAINYTFDTTGGNGVGINATSDLFIFAINYNYIYIDNGFLTMIYNS